MADLKYDADVQDAARRWVDMVHPTALGYEWVSLFVDACVQLAARKVASTKEPRR